MCGGFVGKVISTVTDAIGLTDTKAAAKAAEKGFDAEAAAQQAKNEAQRAENNAKAQRKKRKASDVLSSVTTDEKKNTLGG